VQAEQNALEPSHNCQICPRLVAFRETARSSWPEWHNGPVPSFGGPTAQLLIVGLAPGLKGANRTGRPFTGDYAGDLLYSTLIQFGFAKGQFAARPDDGLELVNCLITNAVRCVPPENKPTPAEIAACRPFLMNTIAAMPALRGILALGKISHDSVLRALGVPLSAYKFTHGAQHAIGDLIVYDSYHCSRYNTNTGVLTTKMFQDVFAAIRENIPQN